ncbi:hypothetical protein AAT19DRAFT_16603 [Rhodotorula toruloides]|uniref:Uncharacterized protein n=1 Tax=Rhodotorula toruloides TaxID=5286 RepID=A0A2T0A3U0_RHOTO|nr:hypothetical protein AAT19DRAFT_16603 [Rhodotorula toruloides]
MLFRPSSALAERATLLFRPSPRQTSSRTTRSLLALAVAVLALIRTTNALPVDPPFGDAIPARRGDLGPRQDPRPSLGNASLLRRADAIRRQDPRPVVGAPFGDFYISNDKLECEPLRISFGGGQGPPYALNMVKPPVATNGSVEDVEILERIAVAGMPGMTWWSLDGTSLKAGDAVALQIVDAAGQVGYSVNRHVAEARLNEYCQSVFRLSKRLAREPLANASVSQLSGSMVATCALGREPLRRYSPHPPRHRLLRSRRRRAPQDLVEHSASATVCRAVDERSAAAGAEKRGCDACLGRR